MFVIDEIAVGANVPHLHFACDLGACKGACCTLKGGRGAPVSDGEVDEIYNAYPIVEKYLPDEHKAWIEQHGLVEGSPGRYATVCIEEEACVFVHYEKGVAKCSFEKAFHNGEILWRKPLSCHLFPLRGSDESGHELRFEYLPECEPALIKGAREDVSLFKFLKDVLVRAYGDAWYDRFAAECEKRIPISEHRD
ncbi:MAG TPA: DUF3109 family protein [Bacteroidota bacterium]|nr:DUF3109 family protein [Bacteroidota bacterium]